MFIPMSRCSQNRPSPRARELGEQLALFARDYRSENPDMTEADLSAALTQARTHLGPEIGGRCRSKRVIFIALAFAAIILVGTFVLTRLDHGTGSDNMLPMLFIGLMTLGTTMGAIGSRGRCG